MQSSVVTEATGDLFEKTIDGKKYLIEITSGKVYNNDSEQGFIGKLKTGGGIDFDAIDSSDDEDEEDSLTMGLAGGSLAEGSLAEGSLAEGSLAEGSLAEGSVFTEATGELHEMNIEGKKYLVELASGKVYNNDSEQGFIGKLKPSGGIDAEAIDSSDEEDEDDSLVDSLVHHPAPAASSSSNPTNTGHPIVNAGQATVKGSMLDDGSTFTEDSGDLHETTIEGKKYLVEVASGKIYSCNEDQDFVGKLQSNGEIDRAAVDSSDEEEEEEDDAGGSIPAREPSVTTVQSYKTEPSLVGGGEEKKEEKEEKGEEDGGSSSEEVELHEMLYKGRKVLIDKSNKKVYEADNFQRFLGKLLQSGEVDFSAVDSSDDEEEGGGWQ